MDSDYNTVLVRDSRLEKISDKIDLPIYSGSPSNTYSVFNANGNPSTTSIQFSAQIPNNNVAVDRRAYIEATCVFTYKFDNKSRAGVALTNTSGVFAYAGTDAFQSFPLNRMFVSAVARIDNATFSNNVSDNIPSLLRMMDDADLAMYQNGTPVFLDNYRENVYTVAPANLQLDMGNNNPLSGYVQKSYNEFLYPRGCHPVDITVDRGGTDSTIVSADPQSWIITITATFREPLFLSPFLWGNPDKSNNAALLGVRNIDLNLTLGNYARAFSSYANVATVNNGYSFVLSSVSNCKLYLNFMSIPSTLKLPPKFVLPYTQYTRYKTQFDAVGTGEKPITCNNIQLQSVPQLLLVYVQNRESEQTIQSTDTFFPITKVSIQFAAKSGLLSSAEQFQLYKMSRDNGVNLDWYSWSGKATKYIAAGNGGGKGAVVKTTGSVLCINPAKDLSLDEAITNGSGGSFNLQMTVTVNNDSGGAINMDMFVLVCENGYIKNVNGSTTSSIAPLDANQVINALSGSALDDSVEIVSTMSALGGMRPVHKRAHAGARSGGGASRMSKFI